MDSRNLPCCPRAKISKSKSFLWTLSLHMDSLSSRWLSTRASFPILWHGRKVSVLLLIGKSIQIQIPIPMLNISATLTIFRSIILEICWLSKSQLSNYSRLPLLLRKQSVIHIVSNYNKLALIFSNWTRMIKTMLWWESIYQILRPQMQIIKKILILMRK